MLRPILSPRISSGGCSPLSISDLSGTLKSILGANLVGLYMGEDLVVNSLGQVTSWPSRIGPGLAIGATGNYFNQGALNNKRALVSPSPTNKFLFEDTLTAIKSCLSVTVTPTIPTAAQYGLVSVKGSAASAGTDVLFLATSGTSAWAALATPHYCDGAISESLVSGPHIYESEYSTNTTVGIRVGNWSTDPAWPQPIGCVVASSSVLTTIQRLQSLLLLQQYYNINKWASTQLAISLYNIFTTDLVGLWLGEDLIFDGSNNVLSWPGKVGLELTYDGTSSTRKFSQGSIDTHPAITCVSDLGNPKSLVATGPIVKAFISVAAPPVAESSYKEMVATQNANDGFVRVPAGFGDVWYAGSSWTFYRNGLADSTFTPGVPAVFQCEKSTNTSTGIAVGGYNLAGQSPFNGPIGIVVALANVPTSQQRADATTLLRTYYGV